MTDVVSIVTELDGRGIQFRSLTEPFDTTTAGGELFSHICAALAQMNGRIISERTRAGLAAAREWGNVGGRPTVMTPERIDIGRRMRAEKATWQTIADTLGVGIATVRRALAHDDAPAAQGSESDATSELAVASHPTVAHPMPIASHGATIVARR